MEQNPNVKIADKMIGLTEEAAIKAIEKADLIPRLVERDGSYFVVTRDFKLNRVNIHVRDGLVYRVSVN